jgi:ABC-2 type transport system ATP-binding protein
MTMSEIEVISLTKNYGFGRGISDVTFQVKKGETLGFLGPNGAGKSTTMRHLMGFSKPHSGSAKILDKDCRKEYAQILENVGYLPGEVALPEGLNGNGFIDMMQGLRKEKSSKRLQELIEIFSVDMKQSVKRMSIGEKRKLAVIVAFMNDPEILLLDEPTSGLDPVMQEKFIEFIKEEKKRGKTILLSSHIFSEVEALCDRIAIIKDGKIVSVVDAAQGEFGRFCGEEFEFEELDEEEQRVSMIVEDADVNKFLQVIVNYEVSKYVEKPVTLEEYFMHFYKNDRKFGGVSNAKHHKSK